MRPNKTRKTWEDSSAEKYQEYGGLEIAGVQPVSFVILDKAFPLVGLTFPIWKERVGLNVHQGLSQL